MLEPFPDIGWVFAFCPSSPNWSIDWIAMLEEFDWLRNLEKLDITLSPSTLKDNGLAYTKLVCETLVSLHSWQELNEQTRSIIFTATLLSSVIKPTSTKINIDAEDNEDNNDYQNEHIFLQGYRRNNAKIARQILWEIKVPFYPREMIVALINQSLLPFYLFERKDPQFSIIQASQTTRLDWLVIMSQAFVLVCNPLDQKELLDKIELFSEFAKEQLCFDSPYKFPSPHSRFIYFQKVGGDPNYHAYDDTSFEVILMCGLPASGKDTWIKTNLSNWLVISLDEIRKELKIPPHKNQGEIIRESKERARKFLREKKSFVWNATNTMCSRRSQLISLFNSYQARIRIVYLEAHLDELLKRNHKRDETVPKHIIEKMLDNLEVPDLTEAHCVEWVIS